MLDFQENEIITLTAEDGSDIELEYMASTEYEGVVYGAFYPVPEEDEDILDADYDMIILQISQVDGGIAFDSVDDEDILDALGNIFMEMIFGEE